MPCYTEALDIVADSVWAAHIAQVPSVPMGLFHIQHCARCFILRIWQLLHNCHDMPPMPLSAYGCMRACWQV